MFTRSGIFIARDGSSAPTLSDIAISLARQPRFGGHTTQDWSVAEHSIACALMVGDPYMKLAMLLHDAHECVTADVPTTWKTEEVKEQQRLLDIRIYKSLHIELPTTEQHKMIETIDREATIAEALFLGPPGTYEWFNKEATEIAKDAVSEIIMHFNRNVSSQYDVMAVYLNEMIALVTSL